MWKKSSSKQVSKKGEYCMFSKTRGKYTAVASTERFIRIFKDDELQLDKLPHQGRITGLEFSPSKTHHLYSSSLDGTIVKWDVRSGKRVSTINAEEEVFSLAVNLNGKYIAAGLSSHVVIWDAESEEVFRTYSFHQGAQEVTKVLYSNKDDMMLFSSASDGTICQVNTKYEDNDELSAEDEEDALVSVFTIDDTINNFGFFGSDEGQLYVLTGGESLSLWSISEVQEIGKFEGPKKEAGDVKLDYLISCDFDSDSRALYLFGGTFNGNLVVVNVGLSKLVPLYAFREHTEIVRDVNLVSVPGSGKKMYTCGEDGKVVIWNEQKNN